LKSVFLKFKEFIPWLMAGIAGFLAGIAANAMWDTINVWRSGSWGRFDAWNSVCIALFFFFVWIVFMQRDVFFRPRTRFLKDTQKVHPRKHLILFLSHLNPQHGPYEQGIPDWLAPLSDPPDLDADFEKMLEAKRLHNLWNWEMPLRALHHHREKLESAILICSNSATSMGAVHQFLSICKRYERLKNVQYFIYCGKQAKLIPATEHALSSNRGLNFDSFEQLSEAVWRALRNLKGMNAKENEMTIDFTGGMKVTSVVAVATTFNRKINAQYVHTGSCEVVGYDVIFDASWKKEREELQLV
jgi:hypothetical protein